MSFVQRWGRQFVDLTVMSGGVVSKRRLVHFAKVVVLSMFHLFALVCMADDSFSVKTVTAQQRYPWNGKVDIVVTIQGDTNQIAESECEFVATNSSTGAEVLIVTINQVGSDSFTNDVCTRRFLWNAVADVGEIKRLFRHNCGWLMAG